MKKETELCKVRLMKDVGMTTQRAILRFEIDGIAKEFSAKVGDMKGNVVSATCIDACGNPLLISSRLLEEVDLYEITYEPAEEKIPNSHFEIKGIRERLGKDNDFASLLIEAKRAAKLKQFHGVDYEGIIFWEKVLLDSKGNSYYLDYQRTWEEPPRDIVFQSEFFSQAIELRTIPLLTYLQQARCLACGRRISILEVLLGRIIITKDGVYHLNCKD